MADLQAFINKWNGKYADFDGYYGAQCVDLVQYWSQELGGGRFTGNAKDIYGQFPGFYQSIDNTPSNLPQPGDIIVWSGALAGSGGAGHTSIFVNGNLNSFTSFDVNFPSGTPAHLQSHNWNNVVGWLHPKSGVQSENMPTLTSICDVSKIYDLALGRQPYDYGQNRWIDEGAKGWVGIPFNTAVYGIADSAEGQARRKALNEKDKLIAQLQDSDKLTKAQLNELQAKLTAKDQELATLQEKYNSNPDTKILNEASELFKPQGILTRLWNAIKNRS